MSFSVHVDNKKKDILIFGEGPTQGLDGTKLTGEKMYLMNVTVSKTRIYLIYNLMGQIVIYLLMVKKLLILKQNILKL